MPNTFVEGRHTGEFLKSEAQGARSRENIVVAAGSGILAAGTVLGLIAAATASAAAVAGNAGNGTISAVTAGGGVVDGVYKVEFTAPTKFEIVDPDGKEIGRGTVGQAVAGPLGFTITAGGTPFASGDGFDITVAVGAKKYGPTNLAATNGSAKGRAILWAGVDATSADVPAAAIARSAEVFRERLTFHASVDNAAKRATKAAELAEVGIILR